MNRSYASAPTAKATHPNLSSPCGKTGSSRPPSGLPVPTAPLLEDASRPASCVMGGTWRCAHRPQLDADRCGSSDRPLSGRFEALDGDEPVDRPVERCDRFDAASFSACDEIRLGKVEPVDLVDLERS